MGAVVGDERARHSGGAGLGGKKRKKSQEKGPLEPRVRFVLEEDAEALFLKALEDAPPPQKDQVGASHAPKRSKEAKKRRPSPPEATVDLHGYRLEEAKERLDAAFVALLMGASAPIAVTVITGKGIHSGPGGGVLVRAIHEYVVRHYRAHIVRIDASPADVALSGVPWRGHFTVVLKP